MKNTVQAALKAAFPKTIPVFAGYLVLGFGFGLLLQSKGYRLLWAILMSITIYGGSIQYVGVDLLSSGAGILSSALISLLIQARHLFYSLSLLTKYENIGKKKPYLIFGITDETYSLISFTEVPQGINKSWFYFFITLLDQCYWIIGGVCGAVFGALVQINTKGVDFSMTSLFLVLLADNLLKANKAQNRLPAYIGLALRHFPQRKNPKIHPLLRRFPPRRNHRNVGGVLFQIHHHPPIPLCPTRTHRRSSRCHSLPLETKRTAFIPIPN